MYSWNDRNNEREKILLSTIILGGVILILLDTFIKKIFTFARISLLIFLILLLILLIISYFSKKK